MASSIAAVMSTSPTSGAFLMVLGPSPSIAATMCLVTAFFDPRTVMSPRSGPDGSTCQVSVTLTTVGPPLEVTVGKWQTWQATGALAWVDPGGNWASSACSGLPAAPKPRVTRKNTPMAATLNEILLTPDTQPSVVADCMTLIEQEVAGKSGISGTAVKLAYKTAKTFAKGYLQATVESLLPDLVTQLEPYWADFSASGGSGFDDYLAKHSDAVSESLLSVTDARAKISDRPVIIKAYGTVRGGAAKHITAALPNVGALVQKYAG